MKNKRGFEFSFGWLFALIVGAAIIFFAVYFAAKLINFEKKETDTTAAKQFDIILYPVGTGLEENKITLLTFPVESRILFDCLLDKNFGEQVVKTSLSSTVGEEYESSGINSRSRDKYIFSQSVVSGKNFLAFAKPLYLPFKITDLIFVLPLNQKYCFIGSPENVLDEIESLRRQNKNLNSTIYISDINKCPADSRKICFDFKDKSCYASVIGNRLIKANSTVYFEGNALLYGAIFSEPDIYECQLQRLMKRISELSLVYANKEKGPASASCSTGLSQDLINYANMTKAYNKSVADLDKIVVYSNEIGGKNEALSCSLF